MYEQIIAEIIHREQWDFEKDIELQIIKLRDNSFTMCLEHTKKQKWQYCDDRFETLKLAHECFNKTMEKAPININLPISA